MTKRVLYLVDVTLLEKLREEVHVKTHYRDTWLTFLSLIFKAGAARQCKIVMNELAHETNSSSPSTRHHLSELQEFGLISFESRTKGGTEVTILPKIILGAKIDDNREIDYCLEAAREAVKRKIPLRSFVKAASEYYEGAVEEQEKLHVSERGFTLARGGRV